MERATRMIRLAAGPVEYRLDRRGPRAVLMLHGGHMRAGMPLGEDVFARADCTVLAASRPGYGRTPLNTGTSPDGFADVLAELCAALGLPTVAAVVGQSAGGPTAVAMAVRHPGVVRRLVLQSAVGPVPWPDRRTRLGGSLLFAPRTEAVTWALVHAMTRRTPRLALRLLLPELTSRPVAELLGSLSATQRAWLLDLFGHMRSGPGFRNDLRVLAAPGRSVHLAALAARVPQPTLVIATPHDGSVSYAHAESLAHTIPNAHLLAGNAPSHMIWIGDDYPVLAAAITDFLAEEVDAPAKGVEAEKGSCPEKGLYQGQDFRPGNPEAST
ncbi:alpha/beta fold hydrolase [Streptomyces sp. NPDC004111]|uniref:alpha/beta fold hydrolase n=1 Tax=Streptomyces sp. NPDC004111 TaxID=3364690 RepID=UPI0036B34629